MINGYMYLFVGVFCFDWDVFYEVKYMIINNGLWCVKVIMCLKGNKINCF